jgi:GT2 family glycosyltransferase
MGHQPFFSVVVPTYDRPQRLAACLQSLTCLDYRRDGFEVIVVDDGSDVPPEAAVAPFRDRIDVTLLTQPHAGPATARNAGAARARGELLAFTDDDCSPAPDWLRALSARFAGCPSHAIGGRTLNGLPNNSYSTASQLLIGYLYAYYNATADQAGFLASNNLALPAGRFHDIDGFDTTYPSSAAEDRDLCDRWLHRGYRMVYAPEVVVYHAHALTLRSFWRQHFRYGRGAFRFHEARARRGEGRIRVEPRAFYQGLLGYPLSAAPRPRAAVLSALLLLTQAANAAGFVAEWLSRRVGRVDR